MNPLPSYVPLPTPTPGTQVPKIQHVFSGHEESALSRQTRLARLEIIKSAMNHSWTNYREKAWLRDELAPLTESYKAVTLGGWAVTLIDALDTLYLMDMIDEFELGVAAVAEMDFTRLKQTPLSVFETTIRYLGGLLGAYDVSEGKYPVLLTKARDLGDVLYEAFDTQNHLPVTKWSRIGPGIESPHSQTSIAELGTLSLEFTRLSQLTGDPRYYDAVQRVADCLENQQNQTRFPGLFPNVVNARDCFFFDGVSFSLSGAADSVYEYFPKEHQLLGGSVEQYRKMYEIAKFPMKSSLFFRPMTPTGDDVLLTGTVKAYRPGYNKLVPETQHLGCFAGGMVALAAKLFDTPEDLDTAAKLARGCIWAYNQTATGIMPEAFYAVPCPSASSSACAWNEASWKDAIAELNPRPKLPNAVSQPPPATAADLRLAPGISSIPSRSYSLRPEALESLFILYRITGDETWRDAAWDMFVAIESHTRAPYGYAKLEDVTVAAGKQLDAMESFWMAETLKYMWLMFAEPEVGSLDEWVYNTEAHLLRLEK